MANMSNKAPIKSMLLPICFLGLFLLTLTIKIPVMSADLKGDCINEIEKLCSRIEKGNRVYSGFNPLSEETELLFRAVFNGGNHINGFTNASIRKAIFPNAAEDDERVRNRVTRTLAKLKAFGLIAKFPRSFRYKITAKGIRVISAALSIKNTLMPNAMKSA